MNKESEADANYRRIIKVWPAMTQIIHFRSVLRPNKFSCHLYKNRRFSRNFGAQIWGTKFDFTSPIDCHLGLHAPGHASRNPFLERGGEKWREKEKRERSKYDKHFSAFIKQNTIALKVTFCVRQNLV